MVLRVSQLPHPTVLGPNQGNEPVAKPQTRRLKSSWAPSTLTCRGSAPHAITHIQMNHINKYNPYITLKS